MADQKYFYQDGYSAQEEKKLKRYEEWAQKSLEEVKEGVIDGSLNEEQYGAFFNRVLEGWVSYMVMLKGRAWYWDSFQPCP